MPLLFLLSLEASRRRANYGDQHNCYWMFMALMLLNAGLITYMGTLTNFVGAKYQISIQDPQITTQRNQTKMLQKPKVLWGSMPISLGLGMGQKSPRRPLGCLIIDN